MFGRENQILLGDSIGDRTMCDGGARPSTLLKVGFLNDHVEEKLELYRRTFDVVVTGDGSMEWVEELVRETIKSEQEETEGAA